MIPRWVTSDTHFCHDSILEYCPWRRTWASTIEEHDERLIESWRNAVKADDLVLHCGDFSLGPVENVTKVIRQLPGRTMLIRGNHDRSERRMRELGFWGAERQLDFELPGWGYVLCVHNPSRLQQIDCSRYRMILHGHWHGEEHRRDLALRSDVLGKLVDVGIDARRSRRPALLTDVVRAFEQQA